MKIFLYATSDTKLIFCCKIRVYPLKFEISRLVLYIKNMIKSILCKLALIVMLFHLTHSPFKLLHCVFILSPNDHFMVSIR